MTFAFPPLKSTVPHIGWPAIPTPVASQLLAVLSQLEQSQWWSIEKIRAQQWQQLQQLVEHTYQTVPFYKAQLQKIGFNPGETITPEMWKQLPLLSRDRIREQNQELHSQSPPTAHGSIDSVRTSGSTGKPITVYRTEVNRFLWQAATLRDHYWHKRNLTGTLAAIRKFKGDFAPYPTGEKASDWGAPTNILHQTGPMVGIDILTPVTQQAEWLQRQNPEYLITFPSNAAALAEQCQKQGIRLPNLREVRLVGEVVDDTIRETCKAAWSVPITDMYSSQEVGYIALQCPEHEHYHLQSEIAYIEILNSQGDPCQLGEIGKVVVTPLHNFAMPLLRYDIGDYAEVGAPCSCGRGLPVVTKILGRVRNMLRLPNGQQHWPALGELRYAEVAPVTQHQLVQKSLDHIEARLVVERPVTDHEETQLKAIILERLKHPFTVSLTYPEKIERSKGGKFEEFLSEIF